MLPRTQKYNEKEKGIILNGDQRLLELRPNHTRRSQMFRIFRLIIFSLAVIFLLATLSGLNSIEEDRHAQSEFYNDANDKKVEMEILENLASEPSPLEKEQEPQVIMTSMDKSRKKYLIIEDISEQESKAQLHLRNLIFLAQKLNRILVLPNVKNARIGACQGYEFSFYYDLTYFENIKHLVQWISYQQFKEIIVNRTDVTAQSAFFERVARSQFSIDDNHTSCLEAKFNFKWSEEEPVVIMISDGDVGPEVTQRVVKTLEGLDAEVLTVVYKGYNVWIDVPEAQKTIPYAPYLHRQAAHIANALRPLVAFHWRFETVLPEHLGKCAESVVEVIQEVRRKIPFQSLYFLTDYPLAPRILRSNTFRWGAIKKEHDDVIGMLKQHFNLSTVYYQDPALPKTQLPINATNPKTGTNMTFFPIKPWKHRDHNVEGIIEKLIAYQADYFLGAEGYFNWCGRKSRFMEQIVEERQKILNGSAPPASRPLLNDVQYWDLEVKKEVQLLKSDLIRNKAKILPPPS